MQKPSRPASRPALAVAGALVVAISAGSSNALAEQLVVLDETWTHSPDLPDSHYRVDPSPETPASWVSPTDYSQGTAYVYLEVHTKPTAQETRFQVCFEMSTTYACTDQSPTYTTIGTYEWSTPFSNFYVPEGPPPPWAMGIERIACILKDTENNKPSADNVGDEIAALYTPTDVRMVVTIVTPGGVYEPPTPTGDGGGGPGGAGGAGGEGEGGSADPATTSATASSVAATGATSAGPGSTSGAAGTGGDGRDEGGGAPTGRNAGSAGGGGGGGDGDGDGGGGEPPAETSDSDGCSFGAPRPSGSGWTTAALLFAGALFASRRRAIGASRT